jgi:hypothetical protein
MILTIIEVFLMNKTNNSNEILSSTNDGIYRLLS